MRKINLILLGILLIGILTAGVIDVMQKNKETSLSKEAEQWYKDKGITPTYEDFEHDDYFSRCLISNTDFNLPCVVFEKGNLTEKQQEQKLDIWQREVLEDIVYWELRKEASQTKELIREGNISIKIE